MKNPSPSIKKASAKQFFGNELSGITDIKI